MFFFFPSIENEFFFFSSGFRWSKNIEGWDLVEAFLYMSF